MTTGRPFAAALLTVLLSCATRAGDWPQVLGPERMGRAADDERVADAWPAGGPRVRWKVGVGSGYAGPAIADGRVVVFHRVEDEEVAEALDAATGKRLWRRAFPTRYVSTIAPDDGPRCVPVIHQDHVFLYGVEGRLSCLDLRDGSVVWSRDLKNEAEAQDGYFGAGSTPIVVEDRLLVNVGGRPASGIVAVSLKTGKTLWEAFRDDASYSSPVAAKLGGAKQAIFVTRLNAVGIDPVAGKTLWQFPFGQRGPTVNGANPILIGEHVFLTASYGIGAMLARIGESGAKIVWESDDVLSSQYTTPILHEKTLYGIHGRQDVGTASLRAIDPMHGKVLWSEDEFGYATLIGVDDKLVILKTDGTLVLARADPRRYDELARAEVFPSTTRALPALSDGKLFARDEKALRCVDLQSP